MKGSGCLHTAIVYCTSAVRSGQCVHSNCTWDLHINLSIYLRTCQIVSLWRFSTYHVDRPLVPCSHPAQQVRQALNPCACTHTHCQVKSHWRGICSWEPFTAILQTQACAHDQNTNTHRHTRTQKAVMLIQGSAGLVLTRVSLSLTFTNPSSGRKPLRYDQMEFYTMQLKL